MALYYFKMYKKRSHLWFCSICSLGDVSKGNIRKHIQKSHGGATGSLIGPVPAVTTVSSDDMKPVKRRRQTVETRSTPQGIGELSDFLKAHYAYTFFKHIPRDSQNTESPLERYNEIIKHVDLTPVLEITQKDKTVQDVFVTLFRVCFGDLSLDHHKVLWKFGSSPIYGFFQVTYIIEDEAYVRLRFITRLLPDLYQTFLEKTYTDHGGVLPKIVEKWKSITEGYSFFVRCVERTQETFWNRIIPFVPVIPVDPIDFTRSRVNIRDSEL